MASLVEYNVTWLLPFDPDLHLSLLRLQWDIMLPGYYHLAQTSICLSMASLVGYNVTWLLPFGPDLHLSVYGVF